MSRLTKSGTVSQRDINKLMELSNENQFGMNDAYYRLKKYEDLEEQGLLLKLPCKIGTEVYSAEKLYDTIGEKTYKTFFVLSEKFNVNMIEDFGKTVFLTKEEAELALKRLEGAE